MFNRAEFYIDGGIRRGTDVVKALCLGAKAVGMGRPFLYALAFGEAGVDKAIEGKFCLSTHDMTGFLTGRIFLGLVLRDEIETTMRLLGVTSIEQLGPHLLNTKALDHLLADPPSVLTDLKARL